MKIQDLNEDQLNTLIQGVAIRYRVKCDEMNAMIIIQTIQSEYSKYSINDFNEAFIKHCSGKFMISKEQEGNKPYGDLSAQFVCQVINAYKVYKADYNRQHPVKIETKVVPALTYDEIAHHTEKAFNLFKHDQKLTGAKWSEIYHHLKKEGEINIPKEEYKILMMEIRQSINEEILRKEEMKQPAILLSMCLESKIMFDCECLKRVVLNYFEEKKNKLEDEK